MSGSAFNKSITLKTNLGMLRDIVEGVEELATEEAHELGAGPRVQRHVALIHLRLDRIHTIYHTVFTKFVMT